jgi:hypothetical protein
MNHWRDTMVEWPRPDGASLCDRLDDQRARRDRNHCRRLGARDLADNLVRRDTSKKNSPGDTDIWGGFSAASPQGWKLGNPDRLQ